MPNQTKKKILVASLDWGLGHAARCIPLIREYKKQGHEVILASAGNAFRFLKIYFPDMIVLEKPGYRVTYSAGSSQLSSILFQTPRILQTILREHRWLKNIISEYKIDEVVSDNCYGLWNKNIHSVFITHQLKIKCPSKIKFLEKFINRINHFFIRKFDECHVPDIEGENNYAGELSHGNFNLPSVRYIGLLSRFDKSTDTLHSKKYDLLVLISGPEPQRTIFENNIEKLLIGTSQKVCIVRGLPGYATAKIKNENIEWLNHADDNLLYSLLKKSDRIVCRSGYSTIMDLVVLGVKALLVPTPGQTEQEYLAEYNKNKNQFSIKKQDELLKSDFSDDDKNLLGVENYIGSSNDITLMQSAVINKNV